MDADASVLRSGRQWRRRPPPPSLPDGPEPAETSNADREAPGGPSPSGAAAAPLFSCGVCLGTANDPVVTLCGHLFCWPCLYRWVVRRRRRRSRRGCPICKSAVEVGPGEDAGVTPIYGIAGGADGARGGGGGDGDLSSEVPPRPRGLWRAEPAEGSWAEDASQGEGLEDLREGLRVLSRDVDALEERMWRVMFWVSQLRPAVLVAFAAEFARRNGTSAAPVAERRRRRRGRSDASGTQSNSSDGGGDGVYRGTRSRRRLQADL